MIDSIDFENILIGEDVPVRQAMQRLDETGMQVLLVVDENRTLKGIVTDGDIRRFLLKDAHSLNVPVSRAMNRKFFSMPLERRAEAHDELASRKFNHIPLLDSSGRIAGLISSLEFVKERRRKWDNPVVIMAGGEGTRLSPLTKILPKPLMPVGDRTMIERIITGFVRHGFSNFHLIVNYHKELIKSYLAESDLSANIRFVDENERLGTAGGMSLLRDELPGTFLLSNCDVIAGIDYGELLKWHSEQAADITVLGVRKHMEVPYGVIKLDKNATVQSIEEKPSFDFTIMSGIYAIGPGALSLVPNKRAYGMDELIKDCLAAGKRVSCYVIEDGWFDMGQFDEYRNLLKHFGVLDV